MKLGRFFSLVQRVVLHEAQRVVLHEVLHEAQRVVLHVVLHEVQLVVQRLEQERVCYMNRKQVRG